MLTGISIVDTPSLSLSFPLYFIEIPHDAYKFILLLLNLGPKSDIEFFILYSDSFRHF